MKIVCTRTLLSDAIAGVSRAVSSKSVIPALEGILLQAEGFHVTLTGHDTEISITTTIDANVMESGQAVIPAKLFGDLIRRMNGEEVEISTNGNGMVNIRSSSTEFDISCLNVDDYPTLPNPGAEKTLELQAKVLTDMISHTLYAVSQDDKNPVHTGELFSIESEKLTIVALDGYRLAITEQNISSSQQLDIIIPAKALNEVSRLLGDEEEIVKLSANRNYVVFVSNGYTIISRLLEGSFLDYKRVVPQGYKTRVEIQVKPFVEIIERASLIITERLKNPLRITFGEDVVVRCQTNLGKVHDCMSAIIEGEAVEIGFNNRYLLDALRNSGCETVVLELSGSLSPIKVLPSQQDLENGKRSFQFLVLPVRFKND